MGTRRNDRGLSDGRLLELFLGGDAEVREELPRRLHGRLVRVSRWIAPDLAAMGLEEDVVQRGWELLLGMGRFAYDRRRGPALGFLRYVLRSAANDVRAEHADAGQLKYGSGAWEPQRLYVDTMQDALRIRMRAAGGEMVEAAGDGERRLERALEKLNVRQTLALMRRTAPPEVADTMELVYFRDMSPTRAVELTGVDRRTLGRHLGRWVRWFKRRGVF